MNNDSYNIPPFPCLKLADGQKFLLHPTDPQSEEIVAWITDVMHLSPGTEGCEIFVCVTEEYIPEIFSPETGPLVCCLSRGMDRISKAMQMARLGRYIATQTMPRGGMLIHGGLVRYQGHGIILAAPGGTGKSTACSRLPTSWDALSDDATLVVQTPEGRYFAHPWPTWSTFLSAGSQECDCYVEQAVPLSSIFFLHQSPCDQVEPLSRANATAFVTESIRQVVLLRRIEENPDDIMEGFLNMCLPAAERLVNSVPTYILRISLCGAFWEEIAIALQHKGKTGSLSPLPLPSLPLDAPCSFFDDQSIPIIYSGSSMNPTFRDADLLEVVRYGSMPCRVGDVICFTSPQEAIYVIHRIVAIYKNGIQTRGDNNATPDPALVQPDEIIGKVVTASRASGQRTVMGGTAGIILHMLLLARKSFMGIIDSLVNSKNPVGFGVKFIRYCCMYILRPHYVLFSTQNSRFIRVYIGNHVAGEYNTIRNSWRIRPPFSLFIDKNTLPGAGYSGPERDP